MPAVEFRSSETIFHCVEAIEGNNRSSFPLFDGIGRGDHNELQIRMVDACSLFLPAADLTGSTDLRYSTGRQE